MQYKGFKQMKRVAAVILSAAIVLTDVPGVSAAEYEQTSETGAVEETAQEAAGEQTESAPESEAALEGTQGGSAESEQQMETGQTETNAEISESSIDVEQASSDAEVETQAPESEIKSSEAAEPEATESEAFETETVLAEETETEETEETEQTEQASVPIPDIDDSVYVFETTGGDYIDNAAPFAAYNVNGALEKNEQGEYSIDNKDQFILFLSSETDYNDSIVRLNCDVDMKGGTAQFTKPFEGTFIGNGHSIYNYRTEGGLFRQIGSNGEVKGLHLSEVIFSKETASAALAASNNGKITNITVNADIKVTKDMTAAAGIVLENAGTISNCAFAGTITADAETDNTGRAIGGIVSSNTGVVDNCHTLGNISTNAALIGGIAARNYKTIRNCTNHMGITGAYGIGGIVAENTRSVSNCANYGVITQKRYSEEGLAGGIAAKNTDAISDCKNYAKIIGEYKNIGGITGSSSGAVTGCGNYGTVSGAENTGGIVGLFDGTDDGENNRIQNSFNKGNIDAKSNSSSNNQGIGGILGAASKNAVIKIENCYNTAGINGAAETKYLGGIAGVLYKGSIRNTYNTGTVSAAAMTDDFHPYAAVIAGFMGPETDAGCTGSLFLEGNRDILYYRQDGAVPAGDEKRTSAELMGADVLSVLGEGFAPDQDGINDGYPVIKGQSAKAVQYLVMYEPNGGCADVYFAVVTDGSSASEPVSPMKKSASFLGWFEDKAHTKPYNFSERVTKSAVLYAGWESGKLVEDITLEQSEVTLVKGEAFDLNAQIRYVPESAENTTFAFRSSDSLVATVDEKGIVRAVGEGTADIIVKMADGSLDKELTFKVSVSDKANIVRFKLYDDKNTAEMTSIAVSVNDPITVQAVFGSETPKKATVQWTSSRPDYVKVIERTDLIGVNAAKLEGLKPTAELDANGVDIMCTLIYPDQKTTFTGILRVTVKPLAESISLQAGREDVTDKTVIYDIGTKQFIAVGDTKLSEPTDTLSATILPKAANQKVKWSSSDSNVIKFDDDESGKANGSAIGETVVTAAATDGSTGKDGKPVAGKTIVKTRRTIQELSFTPKPMDGNGSISVDKYGRIEIAEGTSIRLVPTYNPVDATERKLKWTNGNKNALELTKVEEGTNILTVTAKKVAQDTIVRVRADATDMGGAFCEIEFIIKPKVEKIKIFRTDDVKREKNLSGGSIGIDPEKDNMTFQLTAVNEPDNASQMVTWKINNTSIADIKDNEDGTCTVKVKGMGSAVITATATDGSRTAASTTLNVNSLASNIEIEGSNMVMKGKTIKLKATVYPKSANSKNVRWLSLTPDYASVNESTGEVKGLRAGYALINATASDGSGASGTHVVWVKDPVEDFDIMEPDGDDNPKNDKLVTGEMIGLDPDNDVTTYKVAARILPSTACQDVEWKSSNEKVAVVEPVGNEPGAAIITAKSLGKAVITASAVDGSGRKASVTVNIGTLVKSIKITGGHYLGVAQKIQLTAEVGDKDATSKTLIWKSSNPRVATVEKDGLVKATGKDGETLITAEAADGSGAKAEHKIYVVGKKNNVDIITYDNNYPIVMERSGSKNKKYLDDIDLSDRETLVIRFKAELSDGSAIRDGVPMDINWSTSNKSIATVEPEDGNSSIGVITVYKAGTVKITAASAEGYESSDCVTLTIKNPNPFVRIQGTGHRLASGKNMKLSTGGIAVDWFSDNEQIAKVNSKGQVTAGRGVSGTATIMASALDGNHFDTYTIHVGDPVREVGIRMNGEQDVTGEKVGIDLMKGYKNSSIQLSALLDGVVSNDVIWKTSNKNIADIDENGVVDIKKYGNVTFTATAADGSNKKGKVTFVVTKQITDMKPAGNTGNIDVGLKKSVQLGVDYKPLTCTVKKAVWESSNPSVVSVNKNSGKITGKSEGSAVVTAKAADNSGASCSFTITVKPAIDKVEIVRADALEIGYQDVIGIDMGTNTNTIALKTNLYTKTNGQYVDIGIQRVNWSTSNKQIAEVDENGVVTAIKSGEVTITATTLDGSRKSGKVKIYIGKLIKGLTPSDNIKNGITLNLRDRKTMELAKEITIAPMTASNQTLVYTSSDKKIATVSAKGKVTAKKAGEAVITVTPKDGSGMILKIPVTVNR